MRKQLAENIVLIGGTAAAKGLKARLKEELLSLIHQPKYKDKLFLSVFKFHYPPAKENYVAWLGGKYLCFDIFIKSCKFYYSTFLSRRIYLWSY